jgi:hypothetical protein
MAESRFTSRPPRGPVANDGSPSQPSAVLAAAMRAQEPALDQVTRARMERNFVQAWRMQAAATVALPRGSVSSSSVRPSSVRVGRAWLVASLAASAVIGGLLALQVSDEGGGQTLAVGSARFDLRIGQGALQSGSVTEGQLLESGRHGLIDVDLGSARLHMAAATRVRFDRMSASELRLLLQQGRVEVDFHPARKGEQRMVIASAAVDVRVVGTRFVVEVDAAGNTEVSVREGVVEVVPRSGGVTRRLKAGERVEVRADGGDATEQAVRDAIDEELGPVAAADSEPVEIFDMAFALDEQPEAPAPRAAMSKQVAARKLTAARKLLRQGKHGAARDRLRGLVDSSAALRYRVEALMLIAESFTAQRDVARASEAYARADALAPRHPAGHNARFAHARLLERHAGDQKAATAAYRRYLEHAPDGALASQAKQALCRLGSTAHCQ